MPDEPLAWYILQAGVAMTDAVAKFVDSMRALDRKISEIEQRIKTLEEGTANGSTQEPLPSTP